MKMTTLSVLPGLIALRRTFDEPEPAEAVAVAAGSPQGGGQGAWYLVVQSMKKLGKCTERRGKYFCDISLSESAKAELALIVPWRASYAADGEKARSLTVRSSGSTPLY